MKASLRDYWEAQNQRQKVLILLAVGLLLAVLLAQFGRLGAGLPLNHRVKQAEARRKSEMRALKVARQEKAEFEAGKTELQRLANGMLRLTDQPPSLATLQGELEKVSRRANCPLQSVGAPRSGKLSDRVSVMEVSVRATGRMRELSRFLEELEKNDPPLDWSSCTLRPDSSKDSKLVVLEGTVRLRCLSEDAADFLSSRSEESRP